MVLRRGLIVLLAVACGVGVSNNYYNQPLLPEMGRELGVDARHMGLVAMMTQVGYALGMLAFVPLSDLVERRRLIVSVQFAVAVALVAVAVSPAFPVLAAASLFVGFTTVIAQVIIPYAASLAEPGERGRVIGSLYTGLLLGILLARTISGFVGQAWGWRAMFWLAAGVAVAMAAVLRVRLPQSEPAHETTYAELMASLWGLVRGQRVLREAALVGGAVFGAFSAFWTTLAFRLAAPPFHYGPRAAGLFGIIGAAGALAAPVAGRLADRRGPRYVVGLAIATSAAAYVLMWALGGSLVGLAVGVILLDVGVQAAQVCNQTRIFALVPAAQGRANTVYMITYFTGGAVGSYLATIAWAHWGWGGVCGVGMALIAGAGVAHLRGSAVAARTAADACGE